MVMTLSGLAISRVLETTFRAAYETVQQPKTQAAAAVLRRTLLSSSVNDVLEATRVKAKGVRRQAKMRWSSYSDVA